MISLVFWTWCLPQTFLGYLIRLFLKKRIKGIRPFRSVKVIYTDLDFGASLGKYIFLKASSDKLLFHEYGHTIQGFIFGPLYLILVGLPSIFWNLIARISPKIRSTYYERYPENWATVLGEKYGTPGGRIGG